jgi:hypothetical protein
MLVSSSSNSQNVQDMFAIITQCFSENVVFKNVYGLVNRLRALYSDPNTRQNGILNYEQLTLILNLYFKAVKKEPTTSNITLALAIALASNESIVQLSAEMYKKCAPGSSYTLVLTACIMLSIDYGIDIDNILRSFSPELLMEVISDSADFYIFFSHHSFESLFRGSIFVNRIETNLTPASNVEIRRAGLCDITQSFIGPNTAMTDDVKKQQVCYPELVLFLELFRRNYELQPIGSNTTLFSMLISFSKNNIYRLSSEIIPKCHLDDSYVQILINCILAAIYSGIDVHDMLQHIHVELIVTIMYNITENQSLYYTSEGTYVLDPFIDVLVRTREISNPESLLSQILYTENSEEFISPLASFNLMVHLADLQSDDIEKSCLNVMLSYVEGIIQE